MSIGTSLKSSVSGLKAVERQIAVASSNISNANTPGYARQRVTLGANVVAGDVQGVSILGITTEVNENLSYEIRAQSGRLAEQNTLSEFYDQIELIYGSPGITPGLSDRVNDFFNAAQTLSDDPEILAVRQNAVTAGEDLANFLSGGAQSLQDLRFEADRQLDQSFDNINNILSEVENLNRQILNFQSGSSGYENVKREQRNALRELSEYFSVSSTNTETGAIHISGPGGVSLLDSRRYEFSYRPLPSVDAVSGGTPFNEVTLSPLGQDGEPIDSERPLVFVSSGISENIDSDIVDGKLRGLLDLRDDILPELNAQLDSLAVNIKDEVNKVHNNGAPFPPPDTLTGNRALTASTELQFTGGATIQLLRPDGSPEFSPYDGEELYPPLNLDFDALISDDGTFTAGDVVNEINAFFGPSANRASVGPLQNVALKLKDDAISDGGGAAFTLEYRNQSAQDVDVQILSVEVEDPNDGSTGYPAVAVSGNSQTVKGGERVDDADGFTLDFSADDNRAEYTVNVTVAVTDENGDVSESVISYTVKDDVEDARNTRYAAQAQTVNSGEGEFITSPSGKNYLRAELVDENGDKVSDGEQGVLRLTAADGTRFAILEGDSAHTATSRDASTATGKGFSAFFGLNDFFVTGDTASDEAAGTALNLQVREDISDAPTLISVGTLSASPQPSNTSEALYTYEFGSGNNGAARALAELSNNVSDFEGTDGIPAISATFSSYSIGITSFMANSAARVKNNEEIEQFAFDGLLELQQQTSGIDVDSELAFVLELENQYVASATVIGTMRSMMDTLSGIFR